MPHDMPLLSTMAAAFAAAWVLPHTPGFVGDAAYVRARYLRERAELEQAGAHAACFRGAGAAVALTARVLADLGIDAATIAREADRVRRETMGESAP